MLNNIKSLFILRKLFEFTKQKTYLKLLKYNKKLQEKLNITIKSYSDFLYIEIELIPKHKYRLHKYLDENLLFINYLEDKSFYHIYFDENKEEIKRNYLEENEKVSKIKILIEPKVKNIYGLFKNCKCIKEINFIKFDREDITNMSQLFYYCESLTKLNIDKLKTVNVTNMEDMFKLCVSLKELNLKNIYKD